MGKQWDNYCRGEDRPTRGYERTPHMEVESEKLSVEKAPELVYFSSLLPVLSCLSILHLNPYYPILCKYSKHWWYAFDCKKYVSLEYKFFKGRDYCPFASLLYSQSIGQCLPHKYMLDKYVKKKKKKIRKLIQSLCSLPLFHNFIQICNFCQIYSPKLTYFPIVLHIILF